MTYTRQDASKAIERFKPGRNFIRKQTPRFRSNDLLADPKRKVTCLDCGGICCELPTMKARVMGREIEQLRRGERTFLVHWEMPELYYQRPMKRGRRYTRTRPWDPEGLDKHCIVTPFQELTEEEKETVLEKREKREPREVEETKYGYLRTHGHCYMKKTSFGRCVHFNPKTKRCNVQHQKPLACRAFFCGRGTESYDSCWPRLRDEYARQQQQQEKKPDGRNNQNLPHPQVLQVQPPAQSAS